MKKAKFKKLSALIVCIAALVIALVVTVVAGAEEKEDAMTAIEAAFADYQVGEAETIDKDGYIGIPLEATTYYDYATHGAAKPGYNGTIAVMYVVNTQVERIGTKTDVEIISSMLERGWIVSVFDYLNSPKAKSPGLDWSTQILRKEFLAGSYFNDTTKIPSGKYYDTFVVPAGYDVSYGNVFWEADKHASDGSLEKIVENWNTDFKNWTSLQNKIVYWKTPDGVQKTTEGEAEWFSDAAGKNAVEATAENANYTKVKYTVAEDVTDCVGPDGTPIDLNLYMHIVYPTTTEENPIDPVPVAVLANSSEYLNTASTSSGMRPQHNGFLFNGYAGANFDYLYQPMCQSDYWGYYDGRQDQGAVTNDRMNYGLQLYSDKKINTAAMRFIRYLTYTQGDTFVFDDESIGVFGNSKGGWFTFLGEAELREYTVSDSSAYAKNELELLINNRINSYTSRRQFIGHNDESRFDNGITEAYTKNGVTIDGGELQPWLTYTDEGGNVKEILGYASWIYASNGSQYEDITEGHAPVFAALHLQDDFSTTTNLFSEVTRCLDIPSMYVIVDLGHTFAYGPEYHHGYDTYQAMFDFANYYLKKDAVKVVYTDPVDKTGAMSTTASITVKFSGGVPESELSKVTLTGAGATVPGTWSAVRGNTEWTFTPSSALLPGTEYTLTVPADIAGDNGKAMGADYTATYYTEDEGVYNVTKTNASGGAYFTLKAPESVSASGASIRFYVSNDAANVAELYAVSNFDASNPGASTKGEFVGSVNLKGIGFYSIDVTKYVLEANAGDEMTFLLQPKKSASVTDTYNLEFAGSITGITAQRYVTATATKAPDNTNAVEFKVIRRNNFTVERFYENTTSVFKNNLLFGSSALTEADYGRQYKVTVRVYDTVSRVVQMTLGKVEGAGVYDKDNAHYNFVTEAGKWVELTFDYTVYETEYGVDGLARKTLEFKANATGCDEAPFYIGGITVTETVTDINLGAADLVLSERGDSYKKDNSGDAFSVGANKYATLKGALLGAKSGDTIVLNKNYTITSADDTNAWGTIGNITLDLNGYHLYTDTTLPIVHVSATTAAAANITVKNGSVYLSKSALIGYSGSTAAGKGKIVNVTLEKLNVFNESGSMLKNVISESTIESASGASVNVNMNGVNIDYKKAYNSKNPVTLLSNGLSSLDVNYVIKGGRISLDGISAVTVFTTFRKTEAVKDEDGKYLTITLPEGISFTELGVTTEGSMKIFSKDSGAVAGIATYSLKTSANATVYGIIPEGYEDTDLYPFVMFDENGNFKGAYSYWLGTSGSGSVIAAARNYVVNAWNGTTYGDNPKEAYIVLRRNYTFASAESYDNLAQVQGTINVDLGGYTLSTSTYAKPILAADSKGFSGAAGQKVFPTTINISNGKLMHGRSGIVSLYTWDSVGDGSIVNKVFSFNFTNITFGFVDNADSVGLLAHTKNPHASTKVAAPFVLTYNDCTFDLRTTKSMYNSALLFNLNTTGKYITVTHNVNGGTIIADNPSKITIASDVSDNYGSSVIFGKGSDGNYLSFRTLTSATAPAGSYKNDVGSHVVFKASGTDGSDTIYTLDTSDNATEYGVIDPSYADASKYPFVVFNKDGGFIGGYETLGKALSGAKTHIAANVWNPTSKTYGSNPLKATILLRRDYTTTSSDNSFNDLAQAQGEILFDLGGYTITQGSTDVEGIFGEAKSKGWSGSGDEKVFPSTYTIINGSFKVLNKSLFTLWMWETVGDGAVGEKLFTFNMKNVNIGYASGATVKNLLFSYGNASATSGCKLSKPAQFFMNFEDCHFDLKTNAPAEGSPNLFNTSNTQWIKNTVTVKGGSILSNSMTFARLYNTEDVYGSTVTFFKGSDGNYTTLTINSSNAAPTEEIPGGSGTVLKFAKESATLYSLSTIITKYGAIPEIYGNTDSYPLAVFQNGWFVAAYKVFADGGNNGGALSKAKELTDGSAAGEKGSQVEILFRADATATNTFPNVGQILGTVVIDLNGNTFTQTYNKLSLLGTVAKNWKGTDDAVFNIFNGNIVLKTALLAFDGYGSGYQDGEGYKTFKVNFDNVNISYAAGSTPSALVGVYGEQLTGGKKSAYEVSFNNCTFDLRGVSGMNCIFDAKDLDTTKTDAIVNIEVKGGSIIASTLPKKLYQFNSDNGSSVTFAKNSDGEYISLVLADGVVLPTPTESSFIVVGGEKLYFHESEPGSNVYTLSVCKNNGVTTHKCSCGAIASECADENNDHSCDVCGLKTECIDVDRNHECDICFAKTECSDANLDHYCDLCGEKSACIDNSNDHLCDICNEKVSECADKNNDHKCDICGEVLSVCKDDDTDGNCDICGMELTPYGIVPEIYPVNTYPFVVFKDGEFVSAETGWAAALKKADSVDGSIIYMRRDYETVKDTDATSNITRSQNGIITVDLGGHVFTRRDAYMFDFYLNANTTSDNLKYVVKNGTVMAEKYLIGHSGHSNATNTKNVDFEFENVSFIVSSKYTATTAWIVIAHSNTSYGLVYTSNMVFTDCVIDMRNNIDAPIISVKDNNQNGDNFFDVNITFNGGSILAKEFWQNSFYKLGENDDVVFGRGSDDKLTKLIMPEAWTISVPQYYYNAEGVNVYFHFVEDIEDNLALFELSECVDEENGHKCDCGTRLTPCVDNNKNHSCDYCYDTLSECEDGNNDHMCDLCGEKLTACTDTDNNHVCEICGGRVTDCTDENLDHICDVCGEKTECADANKDHACDLCGEKTACTDEDKNHICDYCGEKSSDCSDENKDHNCDLCGAELTKCADENSDHLCDVCGAELTKCADENNDHNCDLCGAELTKCADENNDHFCDLCTAEITKCADENKDHNCDVCGVELTKCADENSDHNCDVCGTKLSDCEDTDNNHNCDLCGAKISECKEEDADHNCDICGEKVSECKDDNNDHICDICTAEITKCADENNDHNCDVCDTKLSDCSDINNDHDCDVCGEELTKCVDENNDHNCDTCDKTLGECADENGDNACDVCGKVIDEGEDD